MATLEQRVIALAQAVGADVKDLTSKRGDLTALSTTAKGNLVAAVNEIFALATAAGTAEVNDLALATDTVAAWSPNKITAVLSDAVASLRTELRGGAGAALDTFAELATAMDNDPTFAATIADGLAKRVRFDASQTLSAGEKLQACTNLGVGNPDTDFSAAYVTAKA